MGVAVAAKLKFRCKRKKSTERRVRGTPRRCDSLQARREDGADFGSMLRSAEVWSIRESRGMALCRYIADFDQNVTKRGPIKIFRGGSERGVQEIFPALLGQAPSK